MKYSVFATALLCAATSVYAKEHAHHDVAHEENWHERERLTDNYQHIINRSHKHTVDQLARPVIGVLSEPVRGDLFIPGTHELERYVKEGDSVSYVPRTHVQFLEQAGIRVIPIDYHMEKDELLDLLSQINGIYLPGDSQLAVTDEKYREAFLAAMTYAEDAAYIAKEHFPVFMMGNTLQTYVRAKQQMPGTLMDMTAHRHSNSKIEMATHPEDTFLFNAFNREKTHATFNTGLFWNKQPSGVTPKSLEQEGTIRNKLKPVAVYSNYDEPFVAIAEGVDLPLYAFTYAVDMTQFYFEDPSATLDNF